MAKKYTRLEDLENLAEQYEIKNFSITVNSRAHRYIDFKKKLVYCENEVPGNYESGKHFSIHESVTLIKPEEYKLAVETIEETNETHVVFYVPKIMCRVSGLDVRITKEFDELLRIEPNFKGKSYCYDNDLYRRDFLNGKYIANIVEENIDVITSTLGISEENIRKFEKSLIEFNNARGNGVLFSKVFLYAKNGFFSDFEEVQKFHNFIDKNDYCRIFSKKDAEYFLSVTKKCFFEDIAKLPEILIDWVRMKSFTSFLRSSYYSVDDMDLLRLNNYPERFQLVVKYYIENGTFKQDEIYTILNTFPPEYWVDDDMIEAFRRFVIKFKPVLELKRFHNAVELIRSIDRKVTKNLMNVKILSSIVNEEIFNEKGICSSEIEMFLEGNPVEALKHVHAVTATIY